MKELEKSMIAVDIGSANIKFLVGYMDDGILHIIHSSCEPSKGVVRGDVINEKLVADIITAKFKYLIELYKSYDENRGFKVNIRSFSLSFNNLRLTSKMISVSDCRDLEFKITDVVLQSLSGTLVNKKLENNKTIYDSNILDYLLKTGDDEDSTIDPLDAEVDAIVGNYHTVVGDEELKNSMQKLTGYIKIGKNPIKSGKNLPVASLSPDLFVEGDDLRIGVGVVDIGSELTTLSIYRFRKLQAIYVIPIGSNAVSNDIAKRFDISFDLAEKLKIEHGLNVDSSTKLSSSLFINSADINPDLYKEVIKARYSQIFDHIIRYIGTNNFENKISSLVLIGGGAKLSELSTFITRRFKRHVILGELNTERVQFKEFNLGTTSVLSLLGKVLENNKEGSFFFTKEKSFFGNLFTILEN